MSKSPVPGSIALVLLTALALSACSPGSETPSQPKDIAPSPAQPAPATADTIPIGELSGIALRDGALDFPNDNKVFGVGRTTEDVAGLLAAAGLPGDKVSLSISPLLVRTADRTLLFDTGAGTNFGPSAGNLAQSLADAGVDADRITDVFLSHVHGDHAGGLINAEGALSFPNATIHIASPDWEMLRALNAETAASMGLTQHAQLVAAITSKVVAFEPGADLIPGVVKAVAIRGHTPGHSGFLIGPGDNSLLYTGDAMHHFIVSVQRPDWTIAFDQDAPTAEKSRGDLLAQLAASGQRIYAVHFPNPGVGKIARRGDSYVWVPE